MRRVLLILFIAVFFLLFVESIKAEVKLPAIISSNMVLQRNTSVELWGWADAKEKITIETSWLDKTRTIEADNEGNWRLEVKTTNSKEPQSIQIKSNVSNIILENILFGEVWLCSGQSNMEQSLKGWLGQPVFGSAMAIAKSNNPNLRLFTVNRAGSKTPLKDVENYINWQKASPESVIDFSAIAYFFGEQLQEILDCPVGIIHSSYAGTSIQAWMSNEVISSFQEVDLSTTEISVQGCRHAPTVLFNAMINPLLSYKIKGVIWYQGEENRKYPETYKELFPALVKDWRTRWGIGDFSFYYAQIAPYEYRNKEAFQSREQNSAFMREVQLQCLDLIPNSGIAITMDIGNATCIHPPRKKEVADRLLYNALTQTYGYKTVDGASPVYDSMEIKDSVIILQFQNAKNGLYTYDKLADFEIAGEDRVFYPADARIGKDGEKSLKTNEVVVKSKEVPNPVAVRYAWQNFAVGSLLTQASYLPHPSEQMIGIMPHELRNKMVYLCCLEIKTTNIRENMDKVNINEKLTSIKDYWKPIIVGELNNQLVKLVKIQGEFVMHHHDNEDELFLVVKGVLKMDYGDRIEEVNEGEFIIIPKGVEHRPIADTEAHLLLFEPESVLNTGNIRNELTWDSPERR